MNTKGFSSLPLIILFSLMIGTLVWSISIKNKTKNINHQSNNENMITKVENIQTNQFTLPSNFEECTIHPDVLSVFQDICEIRVYESNPIYQDCLDNGGFVDRLSISGSRKFNEVGEHRCLVKYINKQASLPKSFEECLVHRGLDKNEYFESNECEIVIPNKAEATFDKDEEILMKHFDECASMPNSKVTYYKDSDTSYCEQVFLE